MKKHYLKTLLVGVTILVAFVGLRVYDPFFIETARLKGLDFYQRKQDKIKSENVVVVEIDEDSLEKYGQWPWKRDELAIGIAHAFEQGAAVVVLPIIFAESDRLGGDKAFVDTLYDYPVVTAQSASLKGKGKPVPRGVATINEGINEWVFNYPAAIGPTKEIGEASAGVGMLLTAPELDGVVRRLPLIIQVNKELYPTIPLEVLRLFSGEQSYQAKLSEAGLDAVRVPQFSPIKTDAYGRVWLNFKYKFDSFSYSLSEWPNLEGKIVVFALTAEGLSNTVATPIGISQGYEVSMQALQMMIDNNRLERPAEYNLYEILFAVVIGVLLIISAAYFSYIVNAVLVVLALIAPYFIGWDLFSSQNLLVDYTWPTLAIFVSWVGALFMRFVMEFKLKQQIKKQFETYLSPDQVSQLQKNPDALKLGGEERELSIMFTDVRGFTSISEHYGKNVQGLTQIMNRYMTAMTKNIIENKGTLDKYIGDAQMAFWNAPLDNKEHAIMAVATGLAMLKALKGFNEEISKEGVPAFGMGLGINTGTVVVGNMGSDQRFDYTCLGDHVNLASRLEGQSKPYGVKIVIGPKTQEYVKAIYPTAELDCIAVKGKKEGVNIYTVFEPNVNVNFDSHNIFLQLYRARKWDEAIKLTTSIIETTNTPLADYYLMMEERINFLKDNDPGEGWSGVYRATSK
jgi:adenylate cyclase